MGNVLPGYIYIVAIGVSMLGSRPPYENLHVDVRIRRSPFARKLSTPSSLPSVPLHEPNDSMVTLATDIVTHTWCRPLHFVTVRSRMKSK